MDVGAETPELEATVVELLRETGQLMRRLRAESNPSELSLSQTSTIARLDDLGWATTAELARAERVKPQSMGITLAALEQEGLVQRRPHPTDGRQILFGLTEAGSANRGRNTQMKRAWLATAIARLDAEEQRILVAAVEIIKRLNIS